MKLGLFIIISAALFVGCQPNDAVMQTTESPDYTAIAQAASRASHQFMTKLSEEEKAGNLIPRQFWGEAIEQMNPIRVKFESVNVAVVMSENEQSEEGYYCIPLYSSYLPFDKKDVTFKELITSDDEAKGLITPYLYYYTEQKQ